MGKPEILCFEDWIERYWGLTEEDLYDWPDEAWEEAEADYSVYCRRRSSVPSAVNEIMEGSN